MRTIAKGLGRDRKENEDMKKMRLMVEGWWTCVHFEQYIGAPSRRVVTKPDRVKMERSGRILEMTNAVNKQKMQKMDVSRRPVLEQPKRKMVSTMEGNKITSVTKKPRKGEPSYMEICGQSEASDYSERERERSDSDGWYVVERRKKEKRRRLPESQPVGDCSGTRRYNS